MQPPVSAERPVIFSLHGIRTGGAWQKADLTRVLSEAGFDHLALDFGFFRALRLLRPAVRRRQVDWFRDRYTAEMRGRSSLPSVIAHSFGTYIVAEAMRIYPEVCFNQVILCGLIVRRDFPWSKLIDAGRVKRVLNDCGQRDFWAGVVVWAVDDAGPSGVQGFSDTAGGRVLQRSHPDWRHSDFFYELNYRRNWSPFLQGNTPGPPGPSAGGTTNWRFRLAVLMCLALFATLGSMLLLRLWDPPSPPFSDFLLGDWEGEIQEIMQDRIIVTYRITLTFLPKEYLIEYTVPLIGRCAGRLEFLSENPESVTFQERLTVGSCQPDKIVLSKVDKQTLSFFAPDSNNTIFGVKVSVKGILRKKQ